MPSSDTPINYGWYAAATAALGLAAAPGADAQIVHTNPEPDIVVVDADVPLDFDGDGDPEILMREVAGLPYCLTNQETALGADNITGVVANVVAGYTYFLPLSANATISAGNQVPLARIFQTFTYNGADPNSWLGTDAYAGVRFILDGVTHFGWISVEIPPAGGQMTIKEFAYESTPDTPINAGVIPVELTSFTAQVSGDDVHLAWETASETNNAGFEVQLRQGDDWAPLGFVEGQGTTTEAQTYSYTADGLAIGTHVFRLKQVDFDGAFEYSGEVEATVEVVGSHVLSNAYPNPFNPQAQFTVAVAREQHVSAALYNMLGQQVATLYDGTVEANAPQALTIDGRNLASGTYVVRVTGETFADALRVTLAK